MRSSRRHYIRSDVGWKDAIARGLLCVHGFEDRTIKKGLSQAHLCDVEPPVKLVC